MSNSDKEVIKFIESRFDELKNLLRVKEEKPMTAKEAAAYMGIKLNYLYKLSSNHEVAFYKPHGKLNYFQRCDLDRWILRNRSKSQEEMERESN